MIIRMFAAAAAMAATMAGSAVAATYQMTLETTVFFSGSEFASFGDDVSIVVLVDNGGSSALNQVWEPTDILSASVTVGTYAAEWGAGTTFLDLSGVNCDFVTDGSGSVTSGFCGSATATGTDNTGTRARLFRNAVRTSELEDIFFSTDLAAGEGWVVSELATVPLPAGSVLLLSGLAMLGALRRRRVATAA